MKANLRMKRLVCELLDISKYRFQVAYSVGFATGLTAILANVVLTLNHHYKYKKARHLVVNLFFENIMAFNFRAIFIM